MWKIRNLNSDEIIKALQQRNNDLINRVEQLKAQYREKKVKEHYQGIKSSNENQNSIYLQTMNKKIKHTNKI